MIENDNLIKLEDKYITVNEQYGHFLRESKICPICLRPDRAAIHIARARDHQTIKEISENFGVSKNDLIRHFEKHFRVSSTNQDIINIIENTDSVVKDVISNAFEGTLDIVNSTSSILRNYAKNLNTIQNRLDVLSDELERDLLEEEEITEFQNLQKLSIDITKNMLKAYQVIDKKLYPPNSEDLWNAILSYKLDVLSKFLDSILVVFSEFENKNAGYSVMIQEMKEVLRLKFNILEEEVLESGGVLNPNKGE